jgi:hypothetical protein
MVFVLIRVVLAVTADLLFAGGSNEWLGTEKMCKMHLSCSNICTIAGDQHSGWTAT